MTSSIKMTTPADNDATYDPRVRSHDFMAFFRSHMMTICLVFWFLTISVSAGAIAIYLIKKLEMDSRELNIDNSTTTVEPNGRKIDEDNDVIYTEYDVLGFLIDAALDIGDEIDSMNRSEVAKGSLKRLDKIKKAVRKVQRRTTDYDYGQDTATVAGWYDDLMGIKTATDPIPANDTNPSSYYQY